MAIKLIVPVNRPITQLFGENPAFYKKWGYAGHNGVDYGIPNGTPVLAAADGTVELIALENGGYGNHVKRSHVNGADKFSTYYAHLASAAVSAGQKVKAGIVIGYSNNSGASTGPHLHFGLKISGKNPPYKDYVDPLPYIAAAGPTSPGAAGVPADAIDLPSLQFEVTYETLNVRSGPGVEYPVVTQLKKGDKITAKRLQSKSVWVEYEPGKWCALAYDGSTYLKLVK